MSPWVSDNPRQEQSHWTLHMDDFSLNDVPRDRPKLKVMVLLSFVKADLKSSNKNKLNPHFFHTPKHEWTAPSTFTQFWLRCLGKSPKVSGFPVAAPQFHARVRSRWTLHQNVATTMVQFVRQVPVQLWSSGMWDSVGPESQKGMLDGPLPDAVQTPSLYSTSLHTYHKGQGREYLDKY